MLYINYNIKLMGYKYGLWYIYNYDEFPTKHIGHFTVTCFMELESAKNLYNEIVTKIGKYNTINIICNEPIKFEMNMYEDDNNNLGSWGYRGIVNNWNELEFITKNYKCNFSHIPHTSIQYEKDEDKLWLQRQDNKVVECELFIVNICSDNPSDWYLVRSDFK